MNFSRLRVTALMALAFPIFAGADDRVVMKNGDVISGNISLVTKSEVFIEPSYTDKFSLKMQEVASIDLDETVEVELADKSVVDARIAVNEAGAQVLDVDGIEKPFDLAQIIQAKNPDPFFEWGTNVEFNATFNDGNTESQNTLLFAQGNTKIGDHRHLADLTFRREELDGIKTKEQDLLNYSYNWFYSKPWYVGGSLAFERDPIRDLDHRYTAGLLVGRDIFDDARKFLSLSFGIAYSDEQTGLNAKSGGVGLWNLRYQHSFWDGVDFFHTQNFAQQFYAQDNLILKTSTGFRFDILDDLYATASLRYDYETEPAASASKDDSTLSLGLGYNF